MLTLRQQNHNGGEWRSEDWRGTVLLIRLSIQRNNVGRAYWWHKCSTTCRPSKPYTWWQFYESLSHKTCIGVLETYGESWDSYLNQAKKLVLSILMSVGNGNICYSSCSNEKSCPSPDVLYFGVGHQFRTCGLLLSKKLTLNRKCQHFHFLLMVSILL